METIQWTVKVPKDLDESFVLHMEETYPNGWTKKNWLINKMRDEIE